MAVIWSLLNQSPGNFASAMWLMQDGSVLVNLFGSTQLVALYPDIQGSYVNGSWRPAGGFLLEKSNFSSAVLSDGRLIACGGQYSGSQSDENNTNFCEIYAPLTQVSTRVAPPAGWPNIGAAPTAVLNDGTFLIGNTQGLGHQVALLTKIAQSRSTTNPTISEWAFGGGDQDNGQGYTLLQTGDVLTTSVYAQTSKRFDPSANAFVSDAELPVMLGASGSTGPGITLMDGRVIWFGASGHTCIYTPGAEGHNGFWVQGPDLPGFPGPPASAGLAPAILEPNGSVLLMASGAGAYLGHPMFLEYNPTLNNFSTVPGAPGVGPLTWGYARMLLLPNGNGLVSLPDGTWYDITFNPGYDPSWAPTITSFPETVTGNTTVTLSGTQLCGLSECAGYGADNQQAENYPLVRFLNPNGEVTYVRAYDVSTRSIAPREPGTVLVDISVPPGTYSVQVVVMGIPSASITVTVVLSENECQELLKSLYLLIGLKKLPVSEVTKVESQLFQCWRQGYITFKEYDDALNAIKAL
jgi:hypothetical protein